MEKVIQYLFDRVDIQDTIARYSFGQDAHQQGDNNVAEQWKDTFLPEARLDFSVFGIPVCTYPELAHALRGDNITIGKMNESFSGWQHMLGLPNVRVEGDQATARTDLWATHLGNAVEGSPAWSLYAAGVFHDELVRTREGWRISHRKLEIYFTNKIVLAEQIS